MLEIITSIICGIFINISILINMKRIIKSRTKIIKVSTLVFVFILSTIYAIFYSNGYSVAHTIANYLLIILFNKIVFKESMKKTLLSTLIILLTIMLSDFINCCIMIIFFSLEQIRVCWYIRLLSNLNVALISVGILSIRVVLEKYRYFINKINKKYVSITFFFIVFIISIIFLTLNITANLKWDVNYIANILIIFILIIYSYLFISEDNEYNRLTEEYDSLFECVNTFEEWIEREQLNRHEYKNQLAVLRSMTKEKKVRDKIDSIIAENININNNEINQLKSIPSGGLKGLLYYKIVIAQNKKLKIELDISLKNKDLITGLEEGKLQVLYKLLGIYLDNAIEAAEKTKKKIISIEIYESEETLNIVISNSFDVKEDLTRINEKGYTTKGKGRGNGLYYAKTILDKNTWINSNQETSKDFYIEKLIINKK